MSNNALFGVLIALNVSIVVLAVGLLVVNNVPGSNTEQNVADSETGGEGYSETLDTLISEINEEYIGDLKTSSDGATIFSRYVEDKIDNGELTLEEAYECYDEMAARVDGEKKFNYLNSYASLYYEKTQDPDGAVEILNRAEPFNQYGESTELNYYAAAMGFYTRAENEEKVKYYEDLIKATNTSTAVYEGI